MTQEVHNNEPIDTQVNVVKNEGTIYLAKKTRFAKRFEKLNQEVINDERYEGIMDELKHYLTKRDGIDMTTKLKEGGFTDKEVFTAMERKEKYAKRLEKNMYFESAQWIDSQIFAKLKINFETYVENPLIKKGANKEEIIRAVVEKVITPVEDLLNTEGEEDNFLRYTIEDIYGMIYYLTGKCHINWKDYDNL